MRDKKRIQVVVMRIIERAAQCYGVDAMDIVAGSQGSRDVSTARYVASYLMYPVLSYTKIGSIMGRRTYNYARGAQKWVEKRLTEDRDCHFTVTVRDLCNEFQAERGGSVGAL